ncbi:uncharacterized protein DUF4129 [Paenibacillus taihuensis]|uniref:Uncharacterized protein DUF4129 n=1 Tax=Paenibacillus taihuensis TaxID=1156355 RepID=A0A3D9RQX7_9BACL|nr:DUF4129 domain-containing protein [Paenibacillus taihuensis]REE80111.1 uncharacterized protein DUF4129 [Paenibacillus taihuensis]
MRKPLSGASLFITTALIELLLHLPLVLIVYIYRPNFGVSLAEMLLLLLGTYIIGWGVNSLIRFVRAFPRMLVAAVIGGVAGILLYGVHFDGIYSAVLLAAAAFRGGRYVITPALLRLIPRDFVLGLMYYFFCSVVFSFKPEFDTYRTLMLICGLFTLVVTLFQTNKSNVNRETLSGAVKPLVEPTVRRHNRIFVGITAVISVLIVLSYQLQAIFGALGHSIAEMFRNLPKGGNESAPQTGGQEAPAIPPELMNKPAKTMPHWVDIALYVIVGIVVCFLLWLVMRQLKHLPEWLRNLQLKLKDLFSRDKGSSSKGYVDQVERIHKSRKLSELWRGRSKEPRVRWKDLKDNESRVRYLYRRWIGSGVRKGYTFRPHLTPIEVAAEIQSQGLINADASASSELVQAYQQVRYGSGRISDEQVGRLADSMSRVDGRNKT